MKKISAKRFIPILVLLIAIIGILFALYYTSESTEQDMSDNSLPWDIWPVLMIDNQYYVWERGADYIWGVFPPENLEYVADIIYVQEEIPTEDYQLMSDFAISGEIYIDLDDTEDRFFCLITTELLSARYISFIPLPDEELLVHYGLEFLIAEQG